MSLNSYAYVRLSLFIVYQNEHPNVDNDKDIKHESLVDEEIVELKFKNEYFEECKIKEEEEHPNVDNDEDIKHFSTTSIRRLFLEQKKGKGTYLYVSYM